MFKVITFNAAILDVRIFGHSFYRPVDHIEARLDCLARAIEHSDADIVFLQELFHRGNQNALCRKLRKRYPYIMGLAPSGWKFRIGNELLTLSRYPLRNGELIRFKAAPAEELRHTSKGFYHLQSDVPGLGKVDLVNFHMSAGGKNQHPESKPMEAIREKQIQQLVDYTLRFENTLIAGDLNAGLHTSIQNYEQIIAAGFCDLFAAAGTPNFTWDPTNPLVLGGRESHLPAQCIDHVFTNNALNNRLQIIDTQLIFTEHCVKTDGGQIPLSDHYGLSVLMKTL